jgi:cytochrome oxidase Cu insertion factor (SCO1/SenC/PrrC family)
VTEQLTEKQQLRKNRKVILGIFGIPALVFILSSMLYYLVENKSIDLGTVNNGELVTPPLQFSGLPLVDDRGEVFDYTKPDPKWAFVVFGDSECIGSCERMLYIARQSIISLAKRMGQLRLMYVTADGVIGNELQQRFEREYIGMDTVSVTDAEVDKLFVDANIDPFQPNSFYVVDNRGWLMMVYQIENTNQENINALGKAVVRDMKRLLK